MTFRGKITFLIFIFFSATPLTALAVSESTNYKVYGGQLDPLVGSIESTSYKFQNISGEPISGNIQSSNYKLGEGNESNNDEDTNEVSGSGGSSYAPDRTAPIIIDLEIVNISDSQALILFTSNEPTVNYIEYGEPGGLNSHTFVENSFRLEHSFILSDLSSNTEYNVTIHSRDISYNSSQSEPYNFKTLTIEDAIPEFEKIEMDDNLSDGDNEMKFVAPAIPNVNHVDIYRSLLDFPDGSNEDELIYRGTAENFSDEGLELGRTHYYTFIARDKDNNIVGVDYGTVFVPEEETVFIDTENIENPLNSNEIGEKNWIITERLFDINFELDNTTLNQANDLLARVIFTSFGRIPTSVELTFEIRNDRGDKVDLRKGEITVETEAVFTENYNDLSLAPGRYILELTTLYDEDIEDKFYADFEIVAQTKACYFGGFRCTNWYVIVSILVVLPALIFVIRRRKVKP